MNIDSQLDEMMKNNKINKEKRVLSLDFARGIAIIFIVFGHSIAKMDSAFYAKLVRYNMTWHIALPLFFIISAAFVTRFMDNIDFDGKKYLKKIIVTILFPFFSLNIVFGIVNLLTPQSFYSTPNIKEMLLGMFLMQSHRDFLASGPLWFLFTLFSSALVTYILVKKLKMDKYSVLVLSFLLSIAYPFYADVTVFGLFRFLYWYRFFVIGYILSTHIINKKIKSPYLLLMLLFLYWLLSFIFTANPGFIWNIAGPIFIILLSYRLEHFMANTFLRFICKCGEKSIIIYVFHMPVYVFIKKGIYLFGLSASYFGLLIMIVSGIVFPLLIGKVLSYNKMLYKFILWRSPA